MKRKGMNIFIIGIVFICLFCVLFILYKKNRFIISENNYKAIIYHSEMQGMDAGTEYIYSIYKSSNTNKRSYFYIKTKSSITYSGSTNPIEMEKKELKSRADVLKIEEDINKDREENSQNNTRYVFMKKAAKIECKSIEDLANKLFS